jgi:hypothetical protein
MDLDVAQLLKRLGGPDLAPSDLSGLEFQDEIFQRTKAVLFARMLERCALHDSVRLTNHDRGEVDFVLCRRHPETGEEVERHLFECKNYKRPLELAVAAKFLLIGLRRLPTSLNLVSASALQRQAAEYAHFFFAQNERELHERRPPGGSTIFRHFITRDLIELEAQAIHGAPDERSREPRLSWELVELRPFSERVVASSERLPAVIQLSAHGYYRIEATLEHERSVDGISLGFAGDFPDALVPYGTTLATDVSLPAVHFSAIFYVRNSLTTNPVAVPRLAMFGDEHRSSPSWSFPDVAIENAIALADMRPAQTDDFESLFGEDDDWRLILLTGEAGVGKTWLCERFAERRRAHDGWDIIQFDVPKNEEGELLRIIAAKLMLPARLRLDQGGSEIEQLANEVVRILAPLPGDKATVDRSPLILSQFVAQAMLQLGPRLIIVRNCERLSEGAARDLEELIRAIELTGWGGSRISLEGRDDEKAADPWRRLCDSVNDLTGVVRFPLSPMTPDEVDRWLDDRFAAMLPELKAIYYDRAGGYPLLIQSVFDWLRRRKTIVLRGTQWHITSPNDFRRRLTTEAVRHASQHKSDGILLARLQSIDFGNLAADIVPPLNDPRVLLGLYALAETPDRMRMLTQMLGLGDVMPELSAILDAEGLLDPAAAGGDLRFRHDRYREAAIELARNADSGVMRAMLRALPPGDTLDRIALELLGDVQLLAGRRAAAWVQYQRAVSAAHEAEAFLDVCRIAAKQEDLFRADRSRARPYGPYLGALNARAWAEWNCGSMRVSRATFRQVITDARRASDVFISATDARALTAYASWRLVGINLELADTAAFLESTIASLSAIGDVRHYNAVLNRLVLFCGRFGLPELGVSLVPFSLAQEIEQGGTSRAEHVEDGAVICADVGRLYLDHMPERALALFELGERRSSGRRQQLWMAIDVLLARYLVTRELDLAHCDGLRDEAVRLGLYAFLVRLDVLRSANMLRSSNRDVDEAERLLRQSRERIAVQEQPAYEIAMANNALVSALFLGDMPTARSRCAGLVRLVGQALEGRAAAAAALAGPIRELVIARWNNYEPSPLGIDVEGVPVPAFCSSLMRAWFNLQSLRAVDDEEIAAEAAAVSAIAPPSLDDANAEAVFRAEVERDGVAWRGCGLALCVE